MFWHDIINMVNNQTPCIIVKLIIDYDYICAVIDNYYQKGIKVKNGRVRVEIMASCILIFSNMAYTCFFFDFLNNLYFNIV